MTTLSLEDRALGFSLAGVAAAYPLDDMHLRVGELLDIGRGSDLFARGVPAFWTTFADPAARDDLCSAYIDVFERGGRFNPLYESAYGHGTTLGKGQTLADVAGFYLAFGFALQEDERRRDMVDHVAAELEFYGLLLLKEAHLESVGEAEGVCIVRDARRSFLEDHLGRVALAIPQREEVGTHSVYSALFTWVGQLVRAECEDLLVQPRPLDPHHAAPEDPDPTQCGPGRLPVLPG